MRVVYTITLLIRLNIDLLKVLIFPASDCELTKVFGSPSEDYELTKVFGFSQRATAS